LPLLTEQLLEALENVAAMMKHRWCIMFSLALERLERLAIQQEVRTIAAK